MTFDRLHAGVTEIARRHLRLGATGARRHRRFTDYRAKRVLGLRYLAFTSSAFTLDIRSVTTLPDLGR